MKRSWKRKFTTVVIAAALSFTNGSLTVVAEETPSISSQAVAYPLTAVIKAGVKSILNEKVAGGTRLGAVVRLYNYGTDVVRVPDYEVRLKTAGGLEYTLHPSAVNATAIQPQETVELSYMIVVDRSDDFSLSELSWAEVDDFEYPRIEKTVLSIPVASVEWKGGLSSSSGNTSVKPWGEPFTIPVLSSSLEFTPVNLIGQNNLQGPVTVVVLLAENKGAMRETVPDFIIDGKSDKKTYSGIRIGQTPVILEPGEKQPLYYAIQTENRAQLNGLTVLTPESFVEAGQTAATGYTVGRLNIQLPADVSSGTVARLEPYQAGAPIRFDPYNKLIRPEVEVSMVELHLHKAEGDGYKTVIAKFKLENRSDSPVPVPDFIAELTSMDGNNYTGTRQSAAAQTLVPKLSYIISYSFNVPDTESGENLAMKILDGQSAAPYSIPVAAFRSQIPKDTDGEQLAFYPFSMKLADWSVSSSLLPASGGLSYSYRLRLNLDVQRTDNVVVDQNFSKMKVELVDSLGRVLGAETASFTGINRLVSGTQTIAFNDMRTDQFEFPLTVHIYEAIDTPFGEAKRLVKILQQ